MVFGVRPSLADPDAQFETVFNASGLTIAAGTPVCIQWSSVGGDGVRVVLPVTGGLFWGIADEDAPDGTYFNIQREGWRAQGALVRNDTVTHIIEGDILVIVNGQTYLQRSGAPDDKSGFVFAAERVNASTPQTTALRKVMIKR
jgi:hypothetical protein